jgi:hypothetical protein
VRRRPPERNQPSWPEDFLAFEASDPELFPSLYAECVKRFPRPKHPREFIYRLRIWSPDVADDLEMLYVIICMTPHSKIE